MDDVPMRGGEEAMAAERLRKDADSGVASSARSRCGDAGDGVRRERKGEEVST